jgi:hypothetical protein
MNIAFRCPHCHDVSQAEFAPETIEIACSHCRQTWPTTGAVQNDKLVRCLVCPSTELFIRKDFSQALGIGIVVAGIILSSVFWAYHKPYWTYAVLFTTALIDVALYFAVGNLLQCYRCQAQYRGIPGLEDYAGFNLETHEKHRQQKIRLAEQQQSAGTK